MRVCRMLAVAGALAVVVSAWPAINAQDANRAVAGGGITVPGWMGQADGTGDIKTAKFEKMGDGFHITTGPAATYWNPANKATGSYKVSAKFDEAKFQNLNDHPHPYGVVIGGNDLGTDKMSLLYCEAYGNGTFIVRGLAPAPFRVGTVGRPTANAAVHKAAGVGQPVSQEIALWVKGDQVGCTINGTDVWTGTKADVVGAGKLSSTDGVYGIRTAHNTEVHVSNFAMSKP
jgi:hypothetical protein